MRYSSHPARLTLLVVVLATSLSLAGCGLKGSLYRPGNTQQSGQPGQSNPGGKPPMSDRVPAPQSQKKESSDTPTAPTTVDPDRPAEPAPGSP